MDISDSPVKQTITFDRPILGSQLIDAVKATCEANGSEFSETKKYDDGWLHMVGRTSYDSAENLLVTPDRENAYIEPGKTYTEAVVLRHDGESRGTRSLARTSIETEVAKTLEFAEALQRTVQHGPQATAGLSRDQATRGADAAVSTDRAQGWNPPTHDYRMDRGR
ncbi:hypothetical protein [Kribbella sp. NPDC004875]|uniref:hypothetical protein n=1 Tax=Kribbella sp. NPDC004875 TaxID=3364107 RepID=UPI0036C0E01B